MSGGRAYTEADHELMREVGARMRKRREELGYKGPREFSKAVEGVEDSAISAIENGRYFPKPIVLLAIARGLGVTCSYLLGDTDADGDYRAGYRTALSDLEHSIHDSLKELRQKGQK